MHIRLYTVFMYYFSNNSFKMLHLISFFISHMGSSWLLLSLLMSFGILMVVGWWLAVTGVQCREDVSGQSEVNWQDYFTILRKNIMSDLLLRLHVGAAGIIIILGNNRKIN